LKDPASLDDIKMTLNGFEGVTVIEEDSVDSYPTPLMANDKDEVFVGRIRKDESADNSFHLWIVSDNLRKGAATNAVQILQYFLDSQN
jgi:aspartate-semialdehyde dehydrogenase